MASSGPLSAGAGANNADAGDSNWSNPGNIVSSNNSRATASTAGSDSWHTIQMIKGGTRSGSNLSSGAALPGADAYVTFGTSTQLWGLSWTDSDINASNFGVAIRCNIGSGFTTQYLHATNFGFAIPSGATIDGIVVEVEARTSGAPEVDHVRITVYYTPGGGGGVSDRPLQFNQAIQRASHW